MDPNACLKLIQEYLDDNEESDALDSVEDLGNWLLKGGFAPNWSKYPEATKFYNKKRVEIFAN